MEAGLVICLQYDIEEVEWQTLKKIWQVDEHWREEGLSQQRPWPLKL